MKIVFLTGSHPRHQYIARKLDSLGYLSALVVQERGEHIPDPPEDLTNERLRDLHQHHFERRAKAEQKFFGEAERPEVREIQLTENEMNSKRMWDFVNDVEHELALTYGVTILSNRSLRELADDAWNIHGGLSPQYKGCITHFWPSYRLEPQMTGITLHKLTENLDGGPIVHQSTGPLVEGDGVHELACRTVKDFADNHLPEVLELFNTDDLKPPKSQESHGKMWNSRDWRPDHLIPIYEKFDNSIVDMFINSEIEGREPDLFSQLG